MSLLVLEVCMDVDLRQAVDRHGVVWEAALCRADNACLLEHRGAWVVAPLTDLQGTELWRHD